LRGYCRDKIGTGVDISCTRVNLPGRSEIKNNTGDGVLIESAQVAISDDDIMKNGSNGIEITSAASCLTTSADCTQHGIRRPALGERGPPLHRLVP
jgi:hypothetical protein